MEKNLIIFSILFLFQVAYGQKITTKYWIVLTDKGEIHTRFEQPVSDKTLQQRKLLQLPLKQWTDLPVAPQYIEKLKKQGIQVETVSKWFNALSADLTMEQVQQVQKLDFVKEVNIIAASLLPAAPVRFSENTEESLSIALKQMNAQAFEKFNLTGKGVSIGIIDAGFEEARQSEELAHIFQEHRVQKVKDFVDQNCRFRKFFKKKTPHDWHGREVWKMIAGMNPVQKQGLAWQADFYLARTDHGEEEKRIEEDHWVAAMEWLDSLGVRLVNTSLGYAYGFNNPCENYKPHDMDGYTTKISQAAQIALKQKGMILVVSAGNEGDNPDWRIISAPADVEGVITVGATQKKVRGKTFYSSEGAAFSSYLKPNVACQASMGTSFSAPVITGMIACLLEKNAALNNQEIKEIIEKSSHLYPYGNNFVGYGIPQADKALFLMENPGDFQASATLQSLNEDTFLIQKINPVSKSVVVFHKKDEHIVLQQSTMTVDKASELLITRWKGSTRCTVDLGEEVLEIIWKNKRR